MLMLALTMLLAADDGRRGDRIVVLPDGQVGIVLEYGRTWDRLEVMPPRMRWDEWESLLPPWDEGDDEE